MTCTNDYKAKKKYVKYLALFLMLISSWLVAGKAADAKTYISDVKLVKGENAVEKLTNEGFTVLQKSINFKGSSDKTWLYLGYKTTQSSNSALRGLMVSKKKKSSFKKDGAAYLRVKGDCYINGKLGKLYLYKTKSSAAGEPITGFNVSEWNKGEKKTTDLALLNDGSTPIMSNTDVAADLDKDATRNLYFMVYRDNMFKKYIKKIGLFKGDDLRTAVIKAANAGYTFYSKKNLTDGNGYTLLAYNMTNDSEDAITDVIASNGGDKKISDEVELNDCKYSLIKNGDVLGYGIYTTKDSKFKPVYGVKVKDSYEGVKYTVGSLAEVFFGNLSDTARNLYIDDEGYNELLNTKTKVTDIKVKVVETSKETPLIITSTVNSISAKKKVQKKYKKSEAVEPVENKDDNKAKENENNDNGELLDEGEQNLEEGEELPNIQENEEGAVEGVEASVSPSTDTDKESNESLGSAFTNRGTIVKAVIILLIILLALMIINMFRKKKNNINALLVLMLAGAVLAGINAKNASASGESYTETYNNATTLLPEDTDLEPMTLPDTVISSIDTFRNDYGFELTGINEPKNVDGWVPAPLKDGEYIIKCSKDQNYALDVKNDGITEGTNCQLTFASYSDYACIRVRIEADEYGWYTITSCCNNYVLDLHRGDSGNVEWHSKNAYDESRVGNDNQKWMIAKKDATHYAILNQWNGKVVDVAGGTYKIYNNIQGYQINNTDAQYFNPVKLVDYPTEDERVIEDGVYKIKCNSVWFKRYYKLTLDNYNSTDGDAFNNRKAMAMGETIEDSEAQKFFIRYIRDGYYVIYNMLSGRPLYVKNNYLYQTEGTTPDEKEFADSVLFKIEKDSDGNYTIKDYEGNYVTTTLNTAERQSETIYSVKTTNKPTEEFHLWDFEKCKLQGAFYLINAWNFNLLACGDVSDNYSDVTIRYLEKNAAYNSAEKLKQKVVISPNGNYYNIDYPFIASNRTFTNKDGDVVIANSEDNNSNQLWSIKQVMDGRYQIVNKKLDKVMDGYGRVVNVSTDVKLCNPNTDNGVCAWQNWVLVPAGCSSDKGYTGNELGCLVSRGVYDWAPTVDSKGKVPSVLKDGIYKISVDKNYLAAESNYYNRSNKEIKVTSDKDNKYSANALFEVINQKTGYVKIKSVFTGNYITGGNDASGNATDGSDEWQVVRKPDGDDYKDDPYVLLNKLDKGLTITAEMENSEKGTIKTSCYAGNSTQEFKFECVNQYNATEDERPLEDGIYRFTSNDKDGVSLSSDYLSDDKKAVLAKSDENDDSQKYYIRYIRDGWYSVINMKTGNHLNSNDGVICDKTDRVYDPYYLEDSSVLWRITKTDKNNYQFIYSDWSLYNQVSGMYIDSEDGTDNLKSKKIKIKGSEEVFANFNAVECDFEGTFYICDSVNPKKVTDVYERKYKEDSNASGDFIDYSDFQKVTINEYKEDQYTLENYETGNYLTAFRKQVAINNGRVTMLLLKYTDGYSANGSKWSMIKNKYNNYNIATMDTDALKSIDTNVDANSVTNADEKVYMKTKYLNYRYMFAGSELGNILIPAGENSNNSDVRIATEKYSSNDAKARVTWYFSKKNKKTLTLDVDDMFLVWEYVSNLAKTLPNVKNVEIKLFDDWTSLDTTSIKINGTNYKAKEGDMGINTRYRDVPILKETKKLARVITGFKNGSIYVPSGVNLTVDLNGHKIVRNVDDSDENGGPVFIVDGSLDIIDSSATTVSPDLVKGSVEGGNNAENGGAVLLNKGSEFFGRNVTFKNNKAKCGGAVYAAQGSKLILSDVDVISNKAAENGAGIYISANMDTAELHNIYSDLNIAAKSGGSMYVEDNNNINVLLDGMNSDGNTVGEKGNGIYLGKNSTVYMKGICRLKLTMDVIDESDSDKNASILDGGLDSNSKVEVLFTSEDGSRSSKYPVVQALNTIQQGYFTFDEEVSIQDVGESQGIYMGSSFTKSRNKIVLLISILVIIIGVPVVLMSVRRYKRKLNNK
ncbi:MAG: hypothetical protein K6D02_02050 [Lachnospiraceae bacterium]|nr:hypothetical protein [Lachnospiraceae bacterium]